MRSALEEVCPFKGVSPAFVSKLNDAESEAAETQCWIRFCVECGYCAKEIGQELNQRYDHIIGKLVNMIINPTPWVLHKAP